MERHVPPPPWDGRSRAVGRVRQQRDQPCRRQLHGPMGRVVQTHRARRQALVPTHLSHGPMSLWHGRTHRIGCSQATRNPSRGVRTHRTNRQIARHRLQRGLSPRTRHPKPRPRLNPRAARIRSRNMQRRHPQLDLPPHSGLRHNQRVRFRNLVRKSALLRSPDPKPGLRRSERLPRKNRMRTIRTIDKPSQICAASLQPLLSSALLS